MEHLGLIDSLVVKLGLDDSLIDDVLSELELVDTVDKIFLGNEVTLSIAGALDTFLPIGLISQDLFHAEKLIFSKNHQL